MKRSEAFPTKYLSKDDITAPTVAVIASIVNETLGQGQEQEVKPILYFHGDTLKPMVCNGTNWDTLEALYGEESDNWHNNRIEIWVDPTVMYGGKRTGGLRLRAPATAAMPANGNGNAPARVRFMARWAELVEQADALGVEHPKLDLAASDAEVVKAGKDLAARIAAVQDEAAF